MPKEKEKTGLYERAVQTITEHVKPYLHEVTGKFVNKSIQTYAKDNPRYARMIEFEIRRRGDGAGLTQDVAEPLIWIGVKSAAALAIQVAAESIKDKKVKWIGRISAFGILANQGIELFRVLPRYKAGLQGSLEMAKDRWRSIEETGVDPFSSQTRQINKSPKITQTLENEVEKPFSQTVKSRAITPDAVMEHKARSDSAMQI